MTILRRPLVMGMLLCAISSLIPFAVWAQGKQWSDKQCRAKMEYLFTIAKDPSVDISEVTQHLGPRALTEFVMYCQIKEANSLRQLEQQLARLEAERAQTDESEWRTNRFGLNMETLKSQAPPYDPGSLPGPY